MPATAIPNEHEILLSSNLSPEIWVGAAIRLTETKCSYDLQRD